MTDTTEREGQVTIDGLVTVSATYDPSIRWNGWLACPWLTREDTEKVLTALAEANSHEERLEWSWYEDEEGRGAILRTIDHNYVDNDRPETLEEATEDLFPRADGRYSLGAYGWVWEEVDR